MTMGGPAKEGAARGFDCSRCGGRLGLCGEVVCPIIQTVKRRLGDNFASHNLFGASPPAVFVGTWNYPRVYAGPLVPHRMWRDTRVMDDPVQWLDEGMDRIISHRLSLIRSHTPVDVHAAVDPDRRLSSVQELAMASQPVDTEVELRTPPRGGLSFSRRSAPMGPTASLKELRLAENPQVHPRIDYLTSDRDCRAQVAVKELFEDGVSTYQLTRLLSVGLLGRAKTRRLVPTKWSITAIDDIVGKRLHRQVLRHPLINEYWVFGYHAVGNSIGLLFLPTPWMFEVLEYWLPSTRFSSRREVVIPSDYELTAGRKTYAKTIEGAYYAARLPVLHHLHTLGKQAGALVFLEVHPEWLPLGVWRVREICARALSTAPARFNSLSEAIDDVSKHLTTPISYWTRQSKILRYRRVQKSLLSFITGT